MPYIAWHKKATEGSDYTIFLGVCQYAERAIMEVKVKALCDAYGWDYVTQIVTTHGYTGHVRKLSGLG